MTSGNSGERLNVQRKRDRTEYRPLTDAGTCFTNRRTSLVDTDEHTTLGEVGRCPVKHSSSNSKSVLKSISEGYMVNDVESGTKVKEEKNIEFIIIYCGEAAVKCEKKPGLSEVIVAVCRLIRVEVR